MMKSIGKAVIIILTFPIWLPTLWVISGVKLGYSMSEHLFFKTR